MKAFACGRAQSRACRLGGGGSPAGGVCQGGVGWRGEHVVSRTGCLKVAQLEGRSRSVRFVHERLTGGVEPGTVCMLDSSWFLVYVGSG